MLPFTKISSLALAFFFVSCSLKPEFKEPDVRFNNNINVSKCIEQGGLDCDTFSNAELVKFDEQWWKVFNDQDLNALVDKALKNNCEI